MDLNALTKKITKAVDIRKTVKVKGLEFELGILSSDEERRINKIIEEIRNSEEEKGLADRMDDMRRHTAAFAIRSIDGEDVPETFEVPVEDSEEKQTILRSEALADKLREWPAIITAALYAAVIDIRKQSNKLLKDEIEFDWFEAPELLEEDEEEEEALKQATEAAEQLLKVKELQEEGGEES